MQSTAAVSDLLQARDVEDKIATNGQALKPTTDAVGTGDIVRVAAGTVRAEAEIEGNGE
jgi:hypothetical protein